MTKIRYIKDSNGQNFFPVTHERAVRDSNGVNLETKLAAILPITNNEIDTIWNSE